MQPVEEVELPVHLERRSRADPFPRLVPRHRDRMLLPGPQISGGEMAEIMPARAAERLMMMLVVEIEDMESSLEAGHRDIPDP